jgi:hypothetical protein
LACPGSLVESDAPYDPQEEWQEDGQDLHEQTGEAIKADATDHEDPLVAKALRVWHETRRGGQPIVEQAIESDRLTGHPDVYTLADALDVDAVIDDWKFGHIHREHRAQMLGYAEIIFSEHEHVDLIETNVYYPRLNICDTELVSRDDVAEMITKLDLAEADAGKRFAPGAECRYCPRRLDCPALGAQRRGAAQAIAEVKPSEISPATLLQLWPQAKMLEQALDSYKKAVKAALQRGEISDGDHFLRLRHRNDETIVPSRAKGIIVREYGQAIWDEASKVAKGKLETAVGNLGAKRGQKKAEAKRQMMASLRAGNAVTTTQKEFIDHGTVDQD